MMLLVSPTSLSFAGSSSAGKLLRATPARIKKGLVVYQTNCVACHGEKGDGQGPAARAIKPGPRNFLTDDFKFGKNPENIFKTVTEGIADTAMPSWKSLSLEERSSVVHYLVATFLSTQKSRSNERLHQ